jgi:GH25 family lysozyme M1 (1,4-beta-N-acetylmuramidase)
MSVNLVDPNLLNTNPNFVNGIPQYQDMFIFAELTAKSRGRTVLETNNTGMYSLSKTGSQDEININFIGNNQNKSATDPNYLKFTTNWYDGSAAEGFRYEGFGISSIKVVTNSSFVPQVNIQFIDVRGLAFFNQEDSPYRILFSFPPPLFTLTIKGYYGMALTYELHLVKYTSEFKAENGSFIIDAQFIARTYAPLTDVLFKYIINFPLMPIAGNDAISINPTPGKPPINTFDLILKLKNLYSQRKEDSESGGGDVNTQRLTDVNTQIDYIQLLMNVLGDYKSTKLKEAGIPKLYVTTLENFVDVNNSRDIKEISIISEYDPIIEASQNNGSSNKNNSRLVIGYLAGNIIPPLIAAPSETNPYPNLTTPDTPFPLASEKTITNPNTEMMLSVLRTHKENILGLSKQYNTGMQIFSEDIPTPGQVSNIIGIPKAAYVLLDITDAYEKLYKKKTELNLEKNDLIEIINMDINNMILGALGMSPTIYNVFKIILDDVDKFFNILRNTSSKAEKEHHVKFRNEILTNNFKDVKNGADGGEKIFAFPLVIDQEITCGKSIDKRIAPTKIKVSEPFPEITLVQDFIDTFITQRNLVEQYDMRQLQNADGSFRWIPISPVDSVLAINSTATKPSSISPYYGVDTSNGGSFPQIIDLSTDKKAITVLKIILKRFYVFSQNSYPYQLYGDESNNYIELFSKSEAANLVSSAYNPEYIRLLSTIGETFKGKSVVFNNFIEKFIPELFNFTEEERKFFNLYDGAELVEPSTDQSGNVYTDKQNINFHGFNIYTGDIVTQEITTTPKKFFSKNKTIVENPIENFLNSYARTDFQKRIFVGRSADSLKFTRENLLFVSDNNVSGAGNNLNVKTDTRFIMQLGYITNVPNDNPNRDKISPGDDLFKTSKINRIDAIKEINTNEQGNYYLGKEWNKFIDKNAAEKLTVFGNIVDTWSEQLGQHDTEIYDTIIKTSTQNKRLASIIYLSNFGYTQSPFNIYPFALNETLFNLPTVVEIPNFLTLYMGGLVGLLPGTEQYDDIYNFFTNGAGRKLNSSGILIFADIVDINNQLSVADKNTLADQYNLFLNSTFIDIAIKIQDLVDTVKKQKIVETKDKITAYKNLLNPGTSSTFYGNILDPLMERNAIVNYSQITFKRNLDVEKNPYKTGYVCIKTMRDDKVDTKKNTINNSYFNAFFNNLSLLIQKRENQQKKQIEEDKKLTGDDDIINQTYYSFKNINDKWLSSPIFSNQSGYPLNSNPNTGLINSFVFVDRGMNPVGNTMINPEILVELLDDPNVSIFTVLTQLLSMNGFEFFPLQNFMNISGTSWQDSFKIDTRFDLRPKPAFVCMYIGGGSSYPTGIESFGGQYKDDGIVKLDDLSEGSGFNVDNCDSTVPTEDNQKETYLKFPWGQVNAFKVKFGEQNQSMFTDVKIDSKEYPETNESIQILSRLAGDNKLQAPTPKGQNLYNLYENRSYKATISGLGNAMIQPTQYFQLENVPLFNGAYIILSVEHNIEPNKMTTNFSGTKILKYPIPRVLQPSVALGFVGGNTDATNAGLASATEIAPRNQAITISKARLGTGTIETQNGTRTGLDSVFGIDVSYAQGVFDWNKAVQNNTANPDDPKLEFAIIKISQGVFADSKGSRNARNAKLVGLKTGYYHYAEQFSVDNKNAIIEDAKTQANFFVSTAKGIIEKPDFPLVLDMENREEKGKFWSKIKPNNDLWINTFITTLKTAGYNTILYGNRSFFNEYTSGNFGSVPLWHAQYPTAPNNSPEWTDPSIARGWSNWSIWQFTSQGKLYGYANDLDMNAMRRSFFEKYKA